MNLMESQKGTLRAFHHFSEPAPDDRKPCRRILSQNDTLHRYNRRHPCCLFALAWKIYLPAVLGMSETTSEKRILSKEEVTRTVSKNPIRTYAMIEWKNCTEPRPGS